MPEHEFQANSGRQVRCFNNKKKGEANHNRFCSEVGGWLRPGYLKMEKKSKLADCPGTIKQCPLDIVHWTLSTGHCPLDIVQVQSMSKSIAALQKSTVIECPKSYRNRSNGMVK